MKKLISVILSVILVFSASAAFAVDMDSITSMFGKKDESGLTLPNIGACYPDELEYITYDEGLNAYMFTAGTAEEVVEITLEYLQMLCDEYGFSVIEYDTDSSDTFVYVYLKEYGGDADIGAQYIDDCTVPCYVLLALTSNDEMAVAVLTGADGISFTDPSDAIPSVGASSDEPAAVPTAAPVTAPAASGAAAYSYAVLPDPGLFFGCERNEDKASDTHQCYLVSYRFGMDDGGFDAVDEFIALLTGGDWQLTQTNFVESDYMDTSGQIFVHYTFRYDGQYDVGSYIDWDGNWDGDVHILIGYYYDRGEIGFSFYFGDGFTLVDSGGHTSVSLDDHIGSSSGGSSSAWDDDEEDVPDCSICWGSGESTCDTCWGTGQVSSSATSSGRETCDDCNGRGRDTCWACGGSGDLY